MMDFCIWVTVKIEAFLLYGQPRYQLFELQIVSSLGLTFDLIFFCLPKISYHISLKLTAILEYNHILPVTTYTMDFSSLSIKEKGEGNGTLLQYSCLENPIYRGAWWAAVHGVTRSRTRLSNFTFTFHFHALEKEMATHCSVLAWRIPGTGEPDGLLSMGSTESDTTEVTAAAATWRKRRNYPRIWPCLDQISCLSFST